MCAISNGGDPAATHWHADLADALTLTGQLDEAAQVIEEGRLSRRPLHRDNVLVSLERSTALLHAAHGDLADAATRLNDLANRQQHLPPPLEHARTLIALADIGTRRRRHASAGDALDHARQICEAAQALPWLELIRRRTDQRTPTNPDPLTPAEKRIATLVTDGATNEEDPQDQPSASKPPKPPSPASTANSAYEPASNSPATPPSTKPPSRASAQPRHNVRGLGL